MDSVADKGSAIASVDDASTADDDPASITDVESAPICDVGVETSDEPAFTAVAVSSTSVADDEPIDVEADDASFMSLEVELSALPTIEEVKSGSYCADDVLSPASRVDNVACEIHVDAALSTGVSRVDELDDGCINGTVHIE